MPHQCIDRECIVHYKLQTHCVVYKPDDSLNCSIPCRLEDCAVKIVNEILCPIYHCQFFTTTTPITTTTSVPDGGLINTSTIVSICFNSIFAIACAVIFCFFVKKRLLLRREQLERASLLDERQRTNNPVVRFSVSNLRNDEHETQELLACATNSKKKVKLSFENFVNQNLNSEIEEVDLA